MFRDLRMSVSSRHAGSHSRALADMSVDCRQEGRPLGAVQARRLGDVPTPRFDHDAVVARNVPTDPCRTDRAFRVRDGSQLDLATFERGRQTAAATVDPLWAVGA